MLKLLRLDSRVVAFCHPSAVYIAHEVQRLACRAGLLYALEREIFVSAVLGLSDLFGRLLDHPVAIDGNLLTEGPPVGTWVPLLLEVGFFLWANDLG